MKKLVYVTILSTLVLVICLFTSETGNTQAQSRKYPEYKF